MFAKKGITFYIRDDLSIVIVETAVLCTEKLGRMYLGISGTVRAEVALERGRNMLLNQARHEEEIVTDQKRNQIDTIFGFLLNQRDNKTLSIKNKIKLSRRGLL